jgi:hypothetical protein
VQAVDLFEHRGGDEFDRDLLLDVGGVAGQADCCCGYVQDLCLLAEQGGLACEARKMTEPYMTNGIFLGFVEMLYGDGANAGVAEQAFNDSDGPFLERITAAINALVRPHLRPERYIEIPADPEQMARADLEALVRPVAEGFLRSQPTKQELLSQLEWIARRQASRPSWMPRTDDSAGADDAPDSSDEPVRLVAMTLSGFPELGRVAVEIPAFYEELMYPADSTDPALLQMALLTVFGATDASAPGRTIRGDGDALDALVPAEQRWWVPPQVALTPRVAAEDVGVAVEVLATTQSLGGMLVQDVDDPDAVDVAADVLLCAGSWQHGPRIVVDGFRPSDESQIRSLARASFAGWASETNEGFVVAIVSGGWEEDSGVSPLGHRLHTSILWWTAPTAGVTEGAGTLRRAVLHCPGEIICQRGGCEAISNDTLLAAVGLVAADAAVAASVAASGDWAADAYRASLLGTGDGEPAEVLSVATEPLVTAGWEEISSSSSELGDAEVLLSRGGQVLTAAYRPLTREVVFADGRSELDVLCQILADEGGLPEGSDGIGRVDRAAVAAEWSDSSLTVIERYLAGGLVDDGALPEPIRILLTGIWPWGNGVPQAEDDWGLVRRQVTMHLAKTTLAG